MTRPVESRVLVEQAARAYFDFRRSQQQTAYMPDHDAMAAALGVVVPLVERDATLAERERIARAIEALPPREDESFFRIVDWAELQAVITPDA